MAEYTGGAAAAGISAGLGKAAEKIEKRDVAKEMAEFEMDLQIQKAKTLKQVQEQFDIEAEVRARANELWKMETASRLDFEQKEKFRQEEIAEYWATEKYIDSKKAEGIDEKEIENMRFMNDYKHEELGLPEITARLGSSPEYMQKLQGVRTQRPASVSEEQWNLLTPEEQLRAARVHAGLEPRAGVEKGIFTPSSIQKGLGILSTGSPVSPLGLPLPTLETKEEHEFYAERNWGPNWKLHIPEAVDVINRKFGLTELKPLSRATMQQFLLASGGNIEQAKQLAKQSGYRVE